MVKGAILTIEQLEVDATKTLTTDSKKALVKIIESEFSTQSTLYNAKARAEKDKILEQYKKGIGFAKMRGELDKIEAQINILIEKKHEAEKAINMKGLTTYGERYDSYLGTSQKDKAVRKALDKVNELFKAVEDMSPNNIRNKIISRLWLANTQGEACVILNQVLGNGIIPQMTTANLLEHKE